MFVPEKIFKEDLVSGGGRRFPGWLFGEQSSVVTSEGYFKGGGHPKSATGFPMEKSKYGVGGSRRDRMQCRLSAKS